LAVVFAIELLAGVGLVSNGRDDSDLQTVCILVVVCFLIGIARAWELVGGPSISISRELASRAKQHRARESSDDDTPK
jgi:hypothetical protein